MALNDILLTIVRVLSIILLAIFIVTGYEGYLVVKDLQTTVHTRLANNEFPLPTGGINLPGLDNSGSAAAMFDFSSIKDPAEQQLLNTFIKNMENKKETDARNTLNQLDVYLAQKGDTTSQAKLQELKAALDSGNTNAAQARLQELVALLSK